MIDAAIRNAEELLSASLTVETRADIDALAAEFQTRNVPFFQMPRDEPWGARDFIVADPDGNLVLFAGPTA